jgi:hypothetical protein
MARDAHSPVACGLQARGASSPPHAPLPAWPARRAAVVIAARRAVCGLSTRGLCMAWALRGAAPTRRSPYAARPRPGAAPCPRPARPSWRAVCSPGAARVWPAWPAAMVPVAHCLACAQCPARRIVPRRACDVLVYPPRRPRLPPVHIVRVERAVFFSRS